MNRVLSLLLIPMFVMGQAFPHSHASTGVVEPDDHASRPHVHLSFDHSHHHGDDHGHDDDAVNSEAEDHGNTGYSLPPRHDDNAIYVAQNIALFSRSTASYSVEFGDCECADQYQCEQPASSPKTDQSPPPARYAGLPIYLLVASLRL